MRYVLALLLLLCTQVHAIPITYRVTFTVDTIGTSTPGQPVPIVVDQPHIGSQYFATFVTDDSILAADGVRSGVPLGFHAQIGSSEWDPNLPIRPAFLPVIGSLPGGLINDFAGFRGPCPPSPFFCLSSPTIGFNVLNHTAMGLLGGVYGSADPPFIDFLGDRFAADPLFFSGTMMIGTETRLLFAEIGLGGTLALQVIPEPGSLALALVGIILVSASRFRSRVAPVAQ
jgi:hypothetical protein